MASRKAWHCRLRRRRRRSPVVSLCGFVPAPAPWNTRGPAGTRELCACELLQFEVERDRRWAALGCQCKGLGVGVRDRVVWELIFWIWDLPTRIGRFNVLDDEEFL